MKNYTQKCNIAIANCIQENFSDLDDQSTEEFIALLQKAMKVAKERNYKFKDQKGLNEFVVGVADGMVINAVKRQRIKTGHA